jgi:hypothetical protein
MHLQVADIDSARMMIHVRHGKGAPMRMRARGRSEQISSLLHGRQRNHDTTSGLADDGAFA